ncbi:16577_t:CDS:2 [Entrophospora sp. SA101]|nr:16577_t:CDS:2 [Entrophospora sp. SA101]CAJ0897868.1 4381_t:CDS:2 [Entrophospora sp. SA101]
MFELSGINREAAYQALHAASYKLPIKCKVIEKNLTKAKIRAKAVSTSPNSPWVISPTAKLAVSNSVKVLNCDFWCLSPIHRNLPTKASPIKGTSPWSASIKNKKYIIQMNTNRKNKELQEKFNSALKIFAGKIEENKQNQHEILESFEKSQGKENHELAKISQQIKPKEETMAIIQNAVDLVDQQIQSRDETIIIQKEEIKTGEETIKSLIGTHKKYIDKIHREIDGWHEQLKEWQASQQQHQAEEAQEEEKRKKKF